MNRLLPQSGIGIELGEENFYAFYARKFWNSVRIVDALEIVHYRQAGPAECGRRYREFLRKNGQKGPWTVVALPRSQVLVRTLRFPAGLEKDLAAALALQLDLLHPFEEGSVIWDFAPASLMESRDQWRRGPEVPKAGTGSVDVLVGIAQQSAVEELAAWFQEAAIPVSQFAVSTSLLLAILRAAVRKQSLPGAACFLLHARPDGCELLCEAAGKAVQSREIPMTPDRTGKQEDWLAAVEHELEAARSEVRLEPEERPSLLVCGPSLPAAAGLPAAALSMQAVAVEPLLPSASSNVAALSLAENILGVGAAMAAAEYGPSLPMNLLPAERRSYQSPLANLPGYALASLVLVLAVGMGARGSVQDWLYSRHLERQRQSLLPRIQELDKLQAASRGTVAHLAALFGLRHSGALPLELLDELTRILPSEAWLQQLQYEGNAVTLSGTAPSASAVLQALAESNYLEAPQFSASLTRTPDGKEIFRIGARLRVPNP